MSSKLTRRSFLRASVMAAAGVAAASCAQPTPIIVEKEVPVEKVVKETVVVTEEKVVKETVVVEQEVEVTKIVEVEKAVEIEKIGRLTNPVIEEQAAPLAHWRLETKEGAGF